jgi:hypothetical protein
MGTNKNVVVSFSIAILLLLSLLLLLTYNSKCNQSHNTAGPAMQNSYNVGNYSKGPEPFYFEKFTQNEPFAQEEQFYNRKPPTKDQENEYDAADYFKQRELKAKWYSSGMDTTPLAKYTKKPSRPSSMPLANFTDYNEGMNVESFGNYNEGMTVEQMADLASVQTSNEVSPQWSARANQQTQNSPMMSSQGQGPAGSFNGDSSFQPVSNMGGMGGGAGAGGSNQQGMQSCFPRDRLTADDLLPKDAADSKWAQINPSGGGNISDQNYLTAGYHVGVNTVGQSLRNANLQLRSEIPNPQDAVGPWMISTIEPDLRQNTLEIGSSISY